MNKPQTVPRQSYSDTHAPAYAYLDAELGPVWSVVWVWPEQRTPTGHLETLCPHRHRTEGAALRCAKTRCNEVRL